MITCRPIVYNEDDLRGYKYTSPSAERQGVMCEVCAASSNLNTIACTIAGATATVPLTMGGAATMAAFTKKYFPVMYFDLDIESVAATINQNDYVVGLMPQVGQIYEVHKSALHNSKTLGSVTAGGYVAIATSGRLCHLGATQGTSVVVGQCIGTFNSAWLRVSVI